MWKMLPRFSGAMAELFNMQSLFNTAEFSNIPNDGYKKWNVAENDNPFDPVFVQEIESYYGIQSFGQHYYTEDSKANLPVFDLRASLGIDAVITARLTGEIKAPYSTMAIPWQEFQSLPGAPANLQKVFLFQTVAGQAPPGSVSSVLVFNSST